MTRVSEEASGRFYLVVNGQERPERLSQHAALRAAQSYGERGNHVLVRKLRKGAPALLIAVWKDGRRTK